MIPDQTLQVDSRESQMAAVARFQAAIRDEGLHARPGNFLRYVRFIYGDVRLGGARVLDVGGGTGMFSFYAGCSGASEVLCLEPEIEGSRHAMVDRFQSIAKRLGPIPVRLLRTTLQQFDSGHGTFDVLLLHNSVNHLDESACMSLHADDASVQSYLRILGTLRELAKPGATLILADCSRHNFFHLIGVRNPFARSIEWQKHQPPEIWIQLLERSGFDDPQLSWTTFNSLGSLGRVALGNRLAAYFLMSHFRLTMRASAGGTTFDAVKIG